MVTVRGVTLYAKCERQQDMGSRQKKATPGEVPADRSDLATNHYQMIKTENIHSEKTALSTNNGKILQ